jgi:hypothetical protein
MFFQRAPQDVAVESQQRLARRRDPIGRGGRQRRQTTQEVAGVPLVQLAGVPLVVVEAELEGPVDVLGAGRAADLPGGELVPKAIKETDGPGLRR